MIKNSIIIYDDQDPRLGSYFKDFANHALCFINMKSNMKKTLIDSTKCNEVYLDEIEFPKHTEKTLFILCSHGSETRYLKNGITPFIESTINCDICLNEGLVYSIACSTGKQFGINITQKNGSFYGYNAPIEILPSHQKISIECDGYGLYKIIIDGSNLNEAKIAAQEKYNYYIDKSNMLNAAKLRIARDSIVIHGNTTKSFF